MKKFIPIAALMLLASCKKENVTPTPPAPVTTLGANYAGGIVFYLENGGQHGMVVTNVDVATCSWSNNLNIINNTSFDFGSGPANTQAIIQNQGPGNYAAKICNDLTLNGYDDWFLPSKFELQEVATRKETLNLGGDYWTSTEDAYPSVAYGWFMHIAPLDAFVSGPSVKTNQFKVRAIRKF